MRLALVILLLSTAAFADDALSHLRTDYQNKVFLLRGFYQDSLLRSDAYGQVKHHAETGSWTTAYVLIKSVDSINGGITFKATRVAQVFDRKKRTFNPGRTNLPVVIQLDADLANEGALRQALANVFIGDHEPSSILRHCLSPPRPPPPGLFPTKIRVIRVIRVDRF
jgi:hypothetical protein